MQQRYSSTVSHSPKDLIRLALDVASAGSSKDLPIGAIVMDSSGSVIASSRNAVIAMGEATAHAELLAIRSLNLGALKRDANSLTIAVTLEPCPMCAWAMGVAGIGRLVFGAYNPQYGAAGSVFDLLRDKSSNRAVEVIGGVLEEECRRLLGDAFLNIRNNGHR